MQKLSRRQFVLGSAAAAASLTLPIGRVLGANEAINMGFIGVGGRGAASVKWFKGIPGVRIAALCDADSQTVAKVQKAYPEAKTAVQDMRRIIEDKNIDAVVISTCNHWHALAAIWACQAGKDVYVEKPISQTVWEGRKMVEAARKYKRIVQGGTQQRSDPVQAQIHALIKSGKLGKMQWIRGNRYGVRAPIGKQATPLKAPSTVDYDLWLGPAQDLPMYREKFHYDWHWVWNTGSGEMGNWGVHILDDIRNMLFDQCGLPVKVMAGGGRVAWDDAGETPNVHYVYFDTGVVPVLFALSNIPMRAGTNIDPHYRNVRSGYVIQFENGYYAGGRGGGRVFDKDGKQIERYSGDAGEAHAKNFIDAVRSRDNTKLNAEIEQVHYSSAWCHLANIAFRLGSDYSKENALGVYKDYAPWQEMVEGFEKLLADNKVEISKAGLKASTVLELDPKKETFVGPSATKEALALLTREYRKPFAVPDQV